MKICLVSAFPPSHGGLSEYGFHIARELQRDPLISLTVLADRLDTPQPELDEFSVVRCWSFDGLGSSSKIARAIRELKPDVVWFNLLFTTFGHNPLVAFAGLATPLLTRLGGSYTHVTLHHLMDVVDLKDAGIRWPRLYRAAGTVATKMLLMANSLSVLMPAYRQILRQKYRGKNVHVRVHGILSKKPEPPAFSLRGNPEHRILAFGKWGTYKRIEPTIEAFRHVAEHVPNARLVVAGGDHPKAKGYVASVAKEFEHVPNIHFTGYVPENDVPHLFRGATVVLMPYASSTGASGVAHIACAYGVPMISADLPDFREMAEEEGLAIQFYPPGQPVELSELLVTLLRSPEMQKEMALQNFSAALRMTMPRVVYDYLRHFHFEHQMRALRPNARSRPAWLASHSVLTPLISASAPALSNGLRSAGPGNGFPTSADGNGHGGGSLDPVVVPVNGDAGGRARLHPTGTARAKQHQSNGESGHSQALPQPATPRPAHADDSKHN